MGVEGVRRRVDDRHVARCERNDLDRPTERPPLALERHELRARHDKLDGTVNAVKPIDDKTRLLLTERTLYTLDFLVLTQRVDDGNRRASAVE